MANRSRKTKSPVTVRPGGWFAPGWSALVLAVITFLIYLPSLASGFVYDGSLLLTEGYFTHISNLPAVLSLQVLGSHLILGDRPGQLLYMMLIATVSGEAPFGYHLCGNLLHAANVALLFTLLLRLTSAEAGLPVQTAAAVATLFFGLHTLAVEAVANISYSSDLLVTFFTLLALHAATKFDPGRTRRAVIAGTIGTLCAFAAVACKQSGAACSAVMIVYWFLYRRSEPRLPWFLFLGAVMAVIVLFLAIYFAIAPKDKVAAGYLGGSLPMVFLLEPQLWVFMMGKLLWPVGLSADYSLIDVQCLPVDVSILILFVVLGLQLMLAWKSRLGTLGVAVYWLGLATVSNFIPLFRILGDRFYYLPLAGVAMQLFALLLILAKYREAFWSVIALVAVALLPLACLTVIRQDVFTNEFTLWSDTVEANPLSTIGHAKLSTELFAQGRNDEAIAHAQRAIEISPRMVEGHNNLGTMLAQTGQTDAAIEQYRITIGLQPNYLPAHFNLGAALMKKGQVDDAIAEFEITLQLDPGNAYVQKTLAQAQALRHTAPPK